MSSRQVAVLGFLVESRTVKSLCEQNGSSLCERHTDKRTQCQSMEMVVLITGRLKGAPSGSTVQNVRVSKKELNDCSLVGCVTINKLNAERTGPKHNLSPRTEDAGKQRRIKPSPNRPLWLRNSQGVQTYVTSAKTLGATKRSRDIYRRLVTFTANGQLSYAGEKVTL